MTDTKDKSSQTKIGGNPSRQKIQAVIANRADEIFGTLFDLMLNGDNDNVKLGAAKTLAAKIIPDLKSNEFIDEEGKTIEGLIIVRSKTIQDNANKS